MALEFKHIGHENWFFWYMTIMIALSLVVYVKMRDTCDQSHIHED